MKVKYQYGKANDKKAEFQNINIRVLQGDFDFRRSLGFRVSKNDWDFDKRTLASSVSGRRSVDERTYILSVQEKLDEITKTFNREFLNLKLSHSLKSLNKEKWNEWCEMTLNKALGIEEEVSEGEPPLLTDLLEEFIRIKSKDRAQNTIRNYRSNTKVLREFMDYSLLEESSKLNPQDKLKLSAWYTKNFGKTKSRLYKFNETDLNFYHLLREWNSLKGNNDNYFYKIISFVKAVLRYFHSIEPNKYKPHNHIEHPDFKAEKLSVPHSVLNEAEIQRLFDYKGLEKYENVSSLAKILYYGCFRWDELEQELKKKDKGSLELVRRNVEGKEVEYWNIYLGKQKIHKTIPVNKTLKSVLFDEDYHFISDQKFRDYLKELLSLLSIEKEYSIGSHSFRRSFITNMINRGYSVVHIMEYSGHQTEAQFREYCRRENIEIKTLNPIHID